MTRSGRVVKPRKRLAEMIDHNQTYEEEYDEGEPAPPTYYDILNHYEGTICGIDFQYEVGKKNIHIDTPNGSMSTFGRDDFFLFIPGVYEWNHLLFVVKPLEKCVDYIVNKKMYKIRLTNNPYQLHLKGRNETEEYTVIEKSLYGTFLIQEDDKICIQFFRNSTKLSPFFTFKI